MLPDFGPRAGIPGVGKRHPEGQRNLEPGAVPRWEHDGQRLGGCRNQVKCPRTVLRLRYEHLRANGWKPCKAFTMVNWCGHGQEYQRWLQSDGWWLLVPILTEAA